MTNTADEIDYSPLTEQVSEADVALYRAQYPEHTNKPVVIILWVLGIGFIALLSFVVCAVVFTLSSLSAGVIVGFLTFAIVCGLAYAVTKQYENRRRERHTRAYKFALRNGFTYMPSSTILTAQTGMIFDEGHSRELRDVFQFKLGSLPLEIGNYQYETGSGKSRTMHYYGYMRLTLPRHVPHMVLDATANNTRIFGLTLGTGLPDTFKKDQVLSLEGDFNDHFTLYCPKQYERDALYIFTPDLMALLMDETSSFDVEVVDNDLYIYQQGLFAQNNVDIFRRLVRIAEIVGAKMHTRTDYYADERVGDRQQDIIALPGRRLKTSLSWVTIIVIILYILFQILDVSKLFINR